VEVPEQSAVLGPAQVHTLLTQVEPVSQIVPQAPQLFASAVMSKQPSRPVPLTPAVPGVPAVQCVSVLTHESAQCPEPSQTCPTAQAVPQAPQL
jgi:hypothetical protein